MPGIILAARRLVMERGDEPNDAEIREAIASANVLVMQMWQQPFASRLNSRARG